ncbi:hypothetical protein MHU86_3428 [Fragilaria crotonensis]|nr:hypothetical protein MHU86_3428 [Fragilaria crotonensis]
MLICRPSPGFRSLLQEWTRAISTSTFLAAEFKRSEVPLVFIHGMKGSHLSSPMSRHWLSLSGLLNLPPKPDYDPSRDFSLPMTYTGMVQERGNLKPDGLVNYIVDVNAYLQFLPFYGHISNVMDQLDVAYKTNAKPQGNITSSTTRPTACFVYDWRRDLLELSDAFHMFCCESFPDRPVQVLAHSMGGLLAISAMRRYPEKYRPGAVMAGVPFGTGIQYLQDLHLGYFTELGRCRQFLPESQFTFSSHWCFFPTSPETLGDAFVDVTHLPGITFEANVPSIGKNLGKEFREPVRGRPIQIDFYNVDDWEKHSIGIFSKGMDEATLEVYRNHMRLQIPRALEFRITALGPAEQHEDIPPLAVGASNTKPTINQILRRTSKNGSFEYDYSSGRSVPGDGRINFTGAFPPVRHKAFELQSLHTKQFIWEDHGGDLGTLLREVEDQLAMYSS